jgi:hypothetical protein
VSDETAEERAVRAERARRMASKGRLCWAADVVALAEEVDRLRHGEKVRDGMLDMFRSGYELDRHRGAWVRVIVSYGDAEQEGHRLTPDEVAVLAALDTEEDA